MIFLISDFLDEITHEIMQIPMVLPSGKIVDRYLLFLPERMI